MSASKDIPVKVEESPKDLSQKGTKDNKSTKLNRFNYSGYFEELDGTWSIKCLAILAVSMLFQVPLKIIVNVILVQPLLSLISPGSLITDGIFLSGLIYGLHFMVKQFRYKRILTLSSLILSATVVVLYLIIFRYSPDYQFYKSSLPYLSWFVYADIFLLTATLRLSSYRTFSMALTVERGSLSLQEDYPSIGGYSDMYGYSGYARNVAEHINATTTESSFGIGVTGTWGSGKTDFMIRLDSELQKNKEENVVFWFNPWLVKSDAIVDEFFKTLSNVLRPFDKSISKDLKEYSKRILQTGKEVHYRLIDSLINNWSDDDTVLKKYNEINDAIGRTGKRFAVMVDDLDRLSGKEIMEVLRIIRNTANFKNIVFVVALDQKYIIEAMKNTKDFANEEEYLKKIFQLVITLPAYKRTLMAQEALRTMITEHTSKEDETLITGVIKRISWDSKDVVNTFFPVADQSGIFENFIGNVRDLKRFVNSFKISFEILKTEVDIADLLVLELIKNKYVGVYNLIRNRKLLSFNKDRTSELILVESELNELEYSAPAKKEIKDAIVFLTSSTGKNQRKFVRVQNFYLYFSYQLFDQISFGEFNTVLEKNADEITSVFNKWISEGKFNELDQILLDLIQFEDAEEFYKMIVVFLGIAEHHDVYLARVQHLLYKNRQENLERYFDGDAAKFRDFLAKLTGDNRLSNLDKSLILHSFLSPLASSNGEPTQIFNDKNQLQKMILELLKNQLGTGEPLYSGAMRILYCNYEQNPGGGRPVQLYDPALRLLESHLMSNEQHFKDYLVGIIRPYGQPYDGNVGFEPFYDKIFTDPKAFREKVRATPFAEIEESRHKILREVIYDYSASYTGAGPFVIEDQEQRKIIEDFMRENGALNMDSDLVNNKFE